MNHRRIVSVIGWGSVLFALVSLVVAVLHKTHVVTVSEATKYIVTGFWLLIPPIWFWAEWMWISGRIDNDERDRIKHRHDLARNIWVALVAILVGLFDIPVFK